MKKILSIASIVLFLFSQVYAEDSSEDTLMDEVSEAVLGTFSDTESIEDEEDDEDDEVASDEEITEYSTVVIDEEESEEKKEKIELAGVSEVPPAKRPRKGDSKKAEEARLKDEGKNAEKEIKETLAFGIETEINDLVKKLVDNDDPRFNDEIYDLFQITKSPAVREKVLEYFTKLEDPCLEDYAVTVLNDPYDEKNSTVEAVFKYVSAVKTHEAIPAIVTLLEGENEAYFNGALTTLGEIGGKTEAKYLVDYLDRSDLTTSQRQALMRVLGKIKAEDTWEDLCKIAQDEDENSFVRMYAAEAIGAMEKQESIPILLKLFESNDPNFRTYVLKGLENYDTKEAKEAIVQGIKDSHYKVRLEAIEGSQKMGIKDSVPYIIYRSKHDPENAVKNKCWEVLAKFGTSEADNFLEEQLRDEKVGDPTKTKIIEAVMKHGKCGRSEIADLAEKLAVDDKRKPFRYSVGKLMAKYPDSKFSAACRLYLASKDAATCALGLDMYSSGRFSSVESDVKSIAENEKAGNNQKKAKKILKIDD